jgi:hypothetical protein
MARARNPIIATAARACLLPALAGAQVIAPLHFVPAADSVTTSAFSCEGTAGGQVDGNFRYGRQRKAEGGYAGGFQEIAFKGEPIDAATLGKLNALVGDRHIENVAPQCQADGSIRLLVQLWDTTQPEDRSRTILGLQRDPDGAVSVTD